SVRDLSLRGGTRDAGAVARSRVARRVADRRARAYRRCDRVRARARALDPAVVLDPGAVRAALRRGDRTADARCEPDGADGGLWAALVGDSVVPARGAIRALARLW